MKYFPDVGKYFQCMQIFITKNNYLVHKVTFPSLRLPDAELLIKGYFLQIHTQINILTF